MDCIYWEPSRDRLLFIHPDERIDSAAYEPVCPVTAIFADNDVPSEEEPFVGINKLYFRDQKAAGATSMNWPC